MLKEWLPVRHCEEVVKADRRHPVTDGNICGDSQPDNRWSSGNHAKEGEEAL